MPDKVQDTKEKDEQKVGDIDIKSLFGDGEKSQDKSDDTDETKKDTSSSEESDEKEPEDLEAKVSALTKELNRVRKGKADSSAEVQELREQLAHLQGQLDVVSRGKSGSEPDENKLAKYTDEQLLQGQTEWEDTLYDERDAARRARADENEAAFNKATKNVNIAKATLNSIRKELLERTRRVSAEQVKAQSETQELVGEIAGLYETTYETYPELKDKDSDLWQAGNAVYNRHPKLMKQLGPMAELVATAIAVTENPKLQKGEGKSEKKARKELLEEINERAEESLLKGKGTSSKKTTPDFGAMSKQDFDGLIHKLKMGG